MQQASLVNYKHRVCEDFVFGRSLAGSAAATALRSVVPSLHPHLITPIVLRQIQPLVRRRDQLSAITAGFRGDGRQADADGQARPFAWRIVRDLQRCHGLAQLFRHQSRTAGRGVGQHQGEFFAAVAGRLDLRPTGLHDSTAARLYGSRNCHG